MAKNLDPQIASELRRVADNWNRERARFANARTATYQTIIKAAELGVPEATLANLFLIDRMTVRKILGKQKPKR